MTSATDLAKRHGALKASRGTFESHWREVAERVLPRQNDFLGAGQTPGAKRTDKVYDSAGEIAVNKFAAVLEALLTPQTQTWHKLKPKNPALADNQEIGEWFDHVNDRLFDARRSPRARFHTMAHEFYLSLGVFGTGAMFIDKAPLGPLLYKACHIGQVYFAENAWGVIDTVHREFALSARQAVQKFDKGRLPSKVVAASERAPDSNFTFVHCVKPNEERAQGKRDYTGMPWASYYFPLEDAGNGIIEEGGYSSFPWAISRYVTAPTETYGRSPAMSALPDIKILNEAMKVTHAQWHQALDPPWLVADEFMGALHARNGAVNRGGLDDQKRPNVVPLVPASNFEVSFELTSQKRETINDIFLVRILQIILDNPQMTATQVLEIAQQKGVLLAPVMGRQQSEFLGPLIERELDLLYSAGMLPDAPEELLLHGGGYDIEYESPLALAQKAQRGVAVMRTWEAIAPMAQADPAVLDEFNVPKMAREVAEANGLPADCFNPQEQIEALAEQRAQQQAIQAGLAGAEQGAGAMKDMAQAAKIIYDDKGRPSEVRVGG